MDIIKNETLLLRARQLTEREKEHVKRWWATDLDMAEEQKDAVEASMFRARTLTYVAGGFILGTVVYSLVSGRTLTVAPFLIFLVLLVGWLVHLWLNVREFAAVETYIQDWEKQALYLIHGKCRLSRSDVEDVFALFFLTNEGVLTEQTDIISSDSLREVLPSVAERMEAGSTDEVINASALFFNPLKATIRDAIVLLEKEDQPGTYVFDEDHGVLDFQDD